MRSITLFALLFALAVKAAPAPQANDDNPDDSSPTSAATSSISGSQATEIATSATDVNLNAAPSVTTEASGFQATGVPFGSISCTTSGEGIPGVNCPFVNAPADETCVEGTNGAQFWLGGYYMGCPFGTHCDPANGGACNGQ